MLAPEVTSAPVLGAPSIEHSTQLSDEPRSWATTPASSSGLSGAPAPTISPCACTVPSSIASAAALA